jgi:hypothetical protein
VRMPHSRAECSGGIMTEKITPKKGDILQDSDGNVWIVKRVCVDIVMLNESYQSNPVSRTQVDVDEKSVGGLRGFELLRRVR